LKATRLKAIAGINFNIHGTIDKINFGELKQIFYFSKPIG